MSALSRNERSAIVGLAAVVAVTAATVVFWLAGSGAELAGGGSGLLISLGRLAGLALMLLVLAQLVLASRAPFLDIEGLVPFRLHRLIGFGIIAVLALHVALLSAGYALASGVSVVVQFVSFAGSWEDVWSALVATLVIVGVGIFSMRAVRRRFRYETWYVTHLMLYAAILLAIGHQIASGDMAAGAARFFWLALVGVVFAIFFAYRVARPLWYFFRCSFRVARVMRETPSTVSIYITGRNLETFHFEAGQYAHVTFLSRGASSHHPFSFSKPYDGKEIRFTVRALGDFTSTVGDLRAGTPVIIDGPMGHFTRQAAMTGKYCFIAGGVGITPIVSLALSLPDRSAAAVLVSNSTREDAPLVDELRRAGVVLHEYYSHGDPSARVDGDKILRACPDVRERDVYICGPEGMTSSLVDALSAQGVPRAQIHTEPFAY